MKRPLIVSRLTASRQIASGLVASGLVVAGGVLGGCSGPKVPSIDDTLPSTGGPTPSAAQPERQLPPPSRHWKGLAAKCPRLTSSAARQLGVSGDGTVTHEFNRPEFGTDVDCRWGAAEGLGTAVTASVTVAPQQAAADAAWRSLSTGRTERLAVGDEAFVFPTVAEGRMAVEVHVRSGNANGVVRLIPARDNVTPARLAELREAAGAITGDVLDDLVPS